MSGVTFSALFRSLSSIAVSAVIALSTTPAVAVQVGDKATDVFHIHGKQIPLPSGEHTVVEVGFASITQPSYGPQVNPVDYGPVQRVVLARMSDTGGIADVVEVITNTLAHPDGWGISTDCTRTDIYATLTRYKSGYDVSCLWVKPVVVDASAPTETDEALSAYAAGTGAEAPTFWIEAGFRVSNRQDLIDVHYRFSPNLAGTVATAADEAAWSPSTIADEAERLPVVQQVAEWASIVYPSVETGLRSPLPTGATFSSPFAASEALSAMKTDRERRIQDLIALHDAGEIDTSEFESQMAVLETETEPEIATGWTYATVAGWKAFTYRVTVTMINGGIDYFFIGTPFAAGVLIILQVVVNTTKFFFHEVMWQELFGVGPLQREFPRVMDFEVASVATTVQ